MSQFECSEPSTSSLKHVNICTIQFILIDFFKHIVGVTSKDRMAGGWSLDYEKCEECIQQDRTPVVYISDSVHIGTNKQMLLRVFILYIF